MSTMPDVRASSPWRAIELLAALGLAVLAIVVGDSVSFALFAALGIALMCRSLEAVFAHTARQRLWWRVVYVSIAMLTLVVLLIV